jgi:DNA-binding NarL/FixJ family response regulator
LVGEGLAKGLLLLRVRLQSKKEIGCPRKPKGAINMINLDEIKITPRDQQVLTLLAQGCSNKEIAGRLNISPRTVKQHLRTLFLRAGIRDGRKRVKLATAIYMKEKSESCNHVNA